MADSIDGTIQNMQNRDPNGIGAQADGDIYRSREDLEPKRESIFVWDSAAYVGPLYKDPLTGFEEVPQYIGFAPDILGLRDGSAGVWRWVDPPKGEIDATRVYGISPDSPASVNAAGLQRYATEMV